MPIRLRGRLDVVELAGYTSRFAADSQISLGNGEYQYRQRSVRTQRDGGPPAFAGGFFGPFEGAKPGVAGLGYCGSLFAHFRTEKMIAEKMIAERDVDPLQVRHFLSIQRALEVVRGMRLGCGGRRIPQIRRPRCGPTRVRPILSGEVSSPRARGPDGVVMERDERWLASSDLR